MINIKLFKKKKDNSNSTVSSDSSSSSTSNIVFPANDWFFFDTDNNAVGCRYDFYSLGNVAANGQSSTETTSFTQSQLEALIAIADKIEVTNGNVIIDATIQQRTP